MFDEEFFKEMGGWFEVEEAEYLYEKATMTEGFVVELGSWEGKSTYALACAIRDSEKPPMIAVDRFTGDRGTGYCWTFPKYHYYLRKGGVLPDHIITMIGEFNEVAKTFVNKSIGLLLYDGSGKDDDLMDAFKAWLPKVRNDGLVCTHDHIVETVIKSGRHAGFELTHTEYIKTSLNAFTIKDKGD